MDVKVKMMENEIKEEILVKKLRMCTVILTNWKAIIMNLLVCCLGLDCILPTIVSRVAHCK